MTTPQVPKIRIYVNLFAYVLATMGFGWVMLSAAHGWRMDLWVQCGAVFVLALVWTLLSRLVLLGVERAARRRYGSSRRSSPGSDPA